MCMFRPKVPKAPSESEVLKKQQEEKDKAAEGKNKAAALALRRNPTVSNTFLGIVDEYRF